MRNVKTWLYTKIKLIEEMPETMQSQDFVKGQKAMLTELVGILHLLDEPTINSSSTGNVSSLNRGIKKSW